MANVGISECAFCGGVMAGVGMGEKDTYYFCSPECFEEWFRRESKQGESRSFKAKILKAKSLKIEGTELN